jgi:hypothetical protein
MPTAFPSIPSASVCVITKNFNPEKWLQVLQVLFEQYSSSTSDPTKILEGYLSIITTGHFSNSAGTVELASFSDADVVKQPSSAIKDLCSSLGIEAVVLWNAVLLKKRILVLSDSVTKLLPVVRALPLFAAHRSDFSVLRPLVSSEQEYHIEDLQSAGVWIAGTIDTDLASQSSLYDVLLNLGSGAGGGESPRVVVTTHAAPGMKMCGFHREVASIITELAEGGGNNNVNVTSADIFAAVGKKTDEILASLKSLVGAEGKLSESSINGKVTNESSQQWLLRLAGSEGLV